MPKEIVVACLHLEASEGYKQARKLLEEQYGNLEQIATAFVDKIIKWKDIRENNEEEYDEYSVTLKTCRNAILCVPYGIAELKNPKTMRLILSKFPSSVWTRWCRVADKIISEKKRTVSFDDLVVCEAKNKGCQEHVNRIRVTSKHLELDRILVESYNHEYDDIASNKREMSAEDRKWLEIIEKGVRTVGGSYEVP
ncbi:uncharacterized protein [Palaemon carinicauda]|uniref:uncharacterized protein n=1 Tax=Palaemon carinicauda TaxID=392227 RepID=UPI0035B67B82